jgi:hypothetical protein
MSDNYAAIIRSNLEKLYADTTAQLDRNLPATRSGETFRFDAFGRDCRLTPRGIFLDDQPETGVPGILISLYGLRANPAAMVARPFKSFKDFPDSMPYIGAFSTHTEHLLLPHVAAIRQVRPRIADTLAGSAGAVAGIDSGDFAIQVRPLPKIGLCYIFYLADEEFPASVTCLFSANALAFMPIDGMADVGETTSRRILELLT